MCDGFEVHKLYLCTVCSMFGDKIRKKSLILMSSEGSVLTFVIMCCKSSVYLSFLVLVYSFLNSCGCSTAELETTVGDFFSPT